jgi:hypothetical protein
MIEVVAHDVGYTLGVGQVESGIGHHLGVGGWSAASEGIGFDILVDKFVGVEFRAVAGQKEEPQACGVFLQPLFDFGAALHGMAVDDDDEFGDFWLLEDFADDVRNGGCLVVNGHDDREAALGEICSHGRGIVNANYGY